MLASVWVANPARNESEWRWDPQGAPSTDPDFL